MGDTVEAGFGNSAGQDCSSGGAVSGFLVGGAGNILEIMILLKRRCYGKKYARKICESIETQCQSNEIISSLT
jgi:hypothetical protein